MKTLNFIKLLEQQLLERKSFNQEIYFIFLLRVHKYLRLSIGTLKYTKFFIKSDIN